MQGQIDTEEEARIDGDAALQTQIDSIQPSAGMNMKAYDAEGNFLGIVLGFPSTQIDLHIPSLITYGTLLTKISWNS